MILWVVCASRLLNLPDMSDAPFLETAIVASAPLITGNVKHFPAKVRSGVQA